LIDLKYFVNESRIAVFSPSRMPKIVTLEAPYDALNIPGLGGQLIEMFRLKLAGYKDVYEYGVLPIDTYDFISTHHVLGVGEGTDFKPVMAFRTSELDKCEVHGLPFPGVAVLQSSRASRHVSVLQNLIRSWQGKRISYASSWTMAPEFRTDREARNLMRDMMVTMLINHELDRKSDHRLLCGVPKVHTDRLFERYGYQRVAEHGDPLPPFAQASLMGEEAVLLHATQFSEEALEIAKRYRHIWDARKVYGLEEPDEAVVDLGRAA
jgi:hypothetical protein